MDSFSKISVIETKPGSHLSHSEVLSLNVLISKNTEQAFIQLSCLFKDEELFEECETKVPLLLSRLDI